MQISKNENDHLSKDDQAFALYGTRVPGGEVRFPPPEFVLNDEKLTPVALSTVGRLYTYTTVHPGKAPAYSLAMVDLDHGLRVFGRLVHGEATPIIGSEVRVVPFKAPNGDRDFAFEPVAEASA